VALSPAQGRRIDAVRNAYRLSALMPAPGSAATESAQLQPLMRECRELLASAKDAWLKFTAGRADSFNTLQQSVHALRGKTETLNAAPMHKLLNALLSMLNALPRPGSGRAISETMAME